MNLLNQFDVQTGNPLLLFALIFSFAFLNVFFPPIPLEGATLFGGYLAGTNRGSLAVIIGAAASGMFLGSLLLFLLIRRYGIKFIERTPLRRAFSDSAHRRAAAWFQRFGLWAAVLAKFIPGMSLLLVISLGALRVESRKALPVLLFSNLLYYSLLGFAGGLLGSHWKTALVWLKYLAQFWVVLLVLAVGYGIVRLFFRRG